MAITDALIARDALVPIGRDPHAKLGAGPVASNPYHLGPASDDIFDRLGISLAEVRVVKSRRPLLRFCVDWSEQQPHLAGRLGAVLATTLIDNGWVMRRHQHRAVTLTDRGVAGLTAIGYIP